MRSRVQGQMQWIKYCMFVFNFLFWLSGIALIVIGGLGELLYGDYQNINQTGFTSATAILISVGFLIAVVGFAGCYGSIRESQGTLKLFSYMLAILLFIEIGLGLWIYFTHFSFYNLVQHFLSQVLGKYEDDKDVKELIDKVQLKYKCCGAKGYKDWFNSEWNKNHQNSSIENWVNNVPHSCCLKNTTHLKTCGDNLGTDSKPAYQDVHTNGCLSGLRDYLTHHTAVVISVGAGIIMIQATAMLLACYLRRAVKNAFAREFGERVKLI